MSQDEVDALERDALEVLRLVKSTKNTLALINRVPPEVLSHIPDYYCEDDTDEELIALTHECRGWRATFISRSSLWTQLNFTNFNKALTYLQRSQSCPLKLYLGCNQVTNDVSALLTPHIRRLKALTTEKQALPGVVENFRCHAPLLEKLDINITFIEGHVLNGTFFNGDLSSLRELHLVGVLTHLPWKALTNLRVVDLESYRERYGTTQILDFLESAPLLHTVLLQYSMPEPWDHPPKRLVPLRHLKVFDIRTTAPHLLLLHHLCIPPGASLISNFHFCGKESPFLDYLPENPPILVTSLTSPR